MDADLLPVLSYGGVAASAAGTSHAKENQKSTRGVEVKSDWSSEETRTEHAVRRDRCAPVALPERLLARLFLSLSLSASLSTLTEITLSYVFKRAKKNRGRRDGGTPTSDDDDDDIVERRRQACGGDSSSVEKALSDASEKEADLRCSC